MQERLVYKKKGSKPNIELTIRRVEPNVWYSLGFYKHHYLTEKLNPACKCFLFEWNEEPVAFVGIINQPRKNRPYDMAISRIVILPDYQGLGLSSKIANFCGGIITAQSTEDNEFRLLIKTAHKKMANGLERSNKWGGTQHDGKGRKKICFDVAKYRNRLTRFSYCKKYVGEKIYGFNDILKPINELRKAKKEKKSVKVNDDFYGELFE